LLLRSDFRFGCLTGSPTVTSFRQSSSSVFVRRFSSDTLLLQPGHVPEVQKSCIVCGNGGMVPATLDTEIVICTCSCNRCSIGEGAKVWCVAHENLCGSPLLDLRRLAAKETLTKSPETMLGRV